MIGLTTSSRRVPNKTRPSLRSEEAESKRHRALGVQEDSSRDGRLGEVEEGR